MAPLRKAKKADVASSAATTASAYGTRYSAKLDGPSSPSAMTACDARGAARPRFWRQAKRSIRELGAAARHPLDAGHAGASRSGVSGARARVGRLESSESISLRNPNSTERSRILCRKSSADSDRARKSAIRTRLHKSVHSWPSDAMDPLAVELDDWQLLSSCGSLLSGSTSSSAASRGRSAGGPALPPLARAHQPHPPVSPPAAAVASQATLLYHRLVAGDHPADGSPKRSRSTRCCALRDRSPRPPGAQDDEELVRFLAATKGSVKRAVEMVAADVRWRARPLKTPPRGRRRVRVCGLDRSGRPCLLVRLDARYFEPQPFIDELLARLEEYCAGVWCVGGPQSLAIVVDAHRIGFRGGRMGLRGRQRCGCSGCCAITIRSAPGRSTSSTCRRGSVGRSARRATRWTRPPLARWSCTRRSPRFIGTSSRRSFLSSTAAFCPTPTPTARATARRRRGGCRRSGAVAVAHRRRRAAAAVEQNVCVRDRGLVDDLRGRATKAEVSLKPPERWPDDELLRFLSDTAPPHGVPQALEALRTAVDARGRVDPRVPDATREAWRHVLRLDGINRHGEKSDCSSSSTGSSRTRCWIRAAPTATSWRSWGARGRPPRGVQRGHRRHRDDPDGDPGEEGAPSLYARTFD